MSERTAIDPILKLRVSGEVEVPTGKVEPPPRTLTDSSTVAFDVASSATQLSAAVVPGSIGQTQISRDLEYLMWRR